MNEENKNNDKSQVSEIQDKIERISDHQRNISFLMANPLNRQNTISAKVDMQFAAEVSLMLLKEIMSVEAFSDFDKAAEIKNKLWKIASISPIEIKEIGSVWKNQKDKKILFNETIFNNHRNQMFDIEVFLKQMVTKYFGNPKTQENLRY